MSIVTTDSGLQYEDLVVGEGPRVTGRGQFVYVDYTGWLENGMEFDSSFDDGEPFGFPLGVRYVIPGWDEGVVGMKVGGKRRLVVPPHLAYGESGAGRMVPPNATLTFEITLREISE